MISVMATVRLPLRREMLLGLAQVAERFEKRLHGGHRRLSDCGRQCRGVASASPVLRQSGMKQVVIENPIINSPFEEPRRHFRFTDEGITNEIVGKRRSSSYFI